MSDSPVRAELQCQAKPGNLQLFQFSHPLLLQYLPRAGQCSPHPVSRDWRPERLTTAKVSHQAISSIGRPRAHLHRMIHFNIRLFQSHQKQNHVENLCLLSEISSARADYSP